MSEKEEYAWKDPSDQLVHLAIIEGHILHGSHDVSADDQFTVCGIALPNGSCLESLDDLDVDCDDCLEQRYGPLVESFVESALKSPVAA